MTVLKHLFTLLLVLIPATGWCLDIRYALGKVLEKQGNTAGAKVHYLQIYERDINFRDIKHRLEGLQEG